MPLQSDKVASLFLKFWAHRIEQEAEHKELIDNDEFYLEDVTCRVRSRHPEHPVARSTELSQGDIAISKDADDSRY